MNWAYYSGINLESLLKDENKVWTIKLKLGPLMFGSLTIYLYLSSLNSVRSTSFTSSIKFSKLPFSKKVFKIL